MTVNCLFEFQLRISTGLFTLLWKTPADDRLENLLGKGSGTRRSHPPCRSTGGRRGRLRLHRGQLPRFDLGLESDSVVAAITERLVLGVAATAQADGGAAREIERVAVEVTQSEVALDPNRSIALDDDFGHSAKLLSCVRWGQLAVRSATMVAVSSSVIR